MNFLFQNKEWIFSGIGITILFGIFKLAYIFFFKKKDHSFVQIQKTGNNSVNIQVGGNLFSKGKKDE